MYRGINAFGFIGLVLMFTILNLLGWKNIRVNTENSWINGQVFSDIETQFDEVFIARQFAINLWTAINLTAFNQGNKGVVIGDNDWLFSTEELNNTPFSDETVKHRLAEIESARSQLMRSGSALIVTIIPSKARVYAEKLPFPMPKHADERYRFFYNWLKQKNIACYSLLSTLIPEDKAPTFIKNDTHWSPLGAKLSAQFIAKQLKLQYQEFDWHTNQFKTSSKQTAPFVGDLLNYLPLEPYFSNLIPVKPDLELFHTESIDETGLFDDIRYSIVLVGTSYSAKPEWNFIGALQQYTGVNVLNMSQEGKGPFLPMSEYLDSTEFKHNPPKIVLWEIPERYLVIDANLTKVKSI